MNQKCQKCGKQGKALYGGELGGKGAWLCWECLHSTKGEKVAKKGNQTSHRGKDRVGNCMKDEI